MITREGTLIEKESGLTTTLQGENHFYVRCVVADAVDPQRHFECRVLDMEDIPVSIGQSIKLEVIRVITERRSGIVRFDCRWIPTTQQQQNGE